MLHNNILNATHWWLAERRGAVDSRPTLPLIIFLFQLLDSLHTNLTQFPPSWPDRRPGQARTGGVGSLTIFLPLTASELSLLRASVAMIGDAYCILQRLSNMNLDALQPPIATLTDSATQFRQIRNFFAHLDERLSDPRTHGISGPVTTVWGHEYTDSARECLHLVLCDQSLHFTERGQLNSVDISRSAFMDVLAAAIPTYNQVTSHTLNAEEYDDLERYWPLLREPAT